MRKELILVKYPKRVVPDALLEQIVKDYTTYFGTACMINTAYDAKGNEVKVDPYLDITHFQGEDVNLKNIKDIQAALLDSPLVFCFGKHPEGFIDEDCQPFSAIRDADGNHLLAVCAAGMFTSYSNDASKHSNPFFATNTHLIPMLDEELTRCNNDFNEFMSKLDNTSLARNITNMGGGDPTTILLMGANGEFKHFGNNPMKTTFEWGWASDTLAGADLAKEEPPKKGLAGLLGKTIKAAVPSIGETKTEVEESPKVVQNKPEKKQEKKLPIIANTTPIGPTITEMRKTDTAVAVASDPLVQAACPAFVKDNRKIQKWYMKGLGFVPENYKDRPEVTVKKSHVDRWLKNGPKGLVTNESKSGLDKLAEHPLAPKPADPPKPPSLPKETVEANRANKDVETHHIPTTTQTSVPKISKTETAASSNEQPHRLTSEQAEAAKEYLKKAVDYNAQDIPDPSHINNLEQKYKSFAQETALNGGIDAVCRWPYEFILDFNKKNPEAGALLIKDLIVDRMARMPKAVQQPEKVSQTDKKVETAPPRRRIAF